MMTASRERHHHRHPLNTALLLTSAFAMVEAVGGWIGNSLALLADAGHMASDIVALGMALLANRIAQRPAHPGMTYGYGRIKLLAAQANGFGLWFLSGWITWEAISRLSRPPEVDAGMVLGIAVIGLLINIAVMFFLHGDDDVNIRAAYWHVFGDALGSIAAVLAGLIILLTGWYPADPLLSFVVAGILIWGGWGLIRETTLELMEGVPENVHPGEIRRNLEAIEGVKGVHHMHIWVLPDQRLAMSAHIELDDITHWPILLPHLQETLETSGITHATLQPELHCCD